jgi:hypothetical protein
MDSSSSGQVDEAAASGSALEVDNPLANSTGVHEVPAVHPELPPLPPFVLHEKFRLIEGQQVEFKQSMTLPAVPKMVQTVCGFLNSAGGWFIIGVRDNGDVIGVDRQTVDTALLEVDRIFHARLIVNTTTGETVTPAEVRCHVTELARQTGELSEPVLGRQLGRLSGVAAEATTAFAAAAGTDAIALATEAVAVPAAWIPRSPHPTTSTRASGNNRRRREPPTQASSPPSQRQHQALQQRFVVVLRAQSIDPTHVFSLFNGDRVYRVNASNLICFGGGVELIQLRNQLAAARREIDALAAANQAMAAHLKLALGTTTIVKAKATRETAAVEAELGGSRAEAATLQGLLYDRILAEKKEAEAAMAAGAAAAGLRLHRASIITTPVPSSSGSGIGSWLGWLYSSFVGHGDARHGRLAGVGSHRAPENTEEATVAVRADTATAAAAATDSDNSPATGSAARLAIPGAVSRASSLAQSPPDRQHLPVDHSQPHDVSLQAP